MSHHPVEKAEGETERRKIMATSKSANTYNRQGWEEAVKNCSESKHS